jgi:hypothetical protein
VAVGTGVGVDVGRMGVFVDEGNTAETVVMSRDKFAIKMKIVINRADRSSRKPFFIDVISFRSIWKK